MPTLFNAICLQGGGHAFIGLYLAKDLIAKGHDVTIMNDGDQVRCTALQRAHAMTSSAQTCALSVLNIDQYAAHAVCVVNSSKPAMRLQLRPSELPPAAASHALTGIDQWAWCPQQRAFPYSLKHSLSLTLPHSALTHTPLQAKLSAKAPFNQYGSVPGLNVAWGSPADPSTYPQGTFDVIYDNNGKDMDSCQPLIDTAKVGVGDAACGWHCHAMLGWGDLYSTMAPHALLRT